MMQLSEVAFGGVGWGPCGVPILVIIAAFVEGRMVARAVALGPVVKQLLLFVMA